MADKFVLSPVDIPPIKSRMYILDLVRAYIAPMYKNLEIISSEKFIDNVTIKIIAIKNCINISAKNDLNQLLKNQLVEFTEMLKKANGDSKINTFTIMKRKE